MPKIQMCSASPSSQTKQMPPMNDKSTSHVRQTALKKKRNIRSGAHRDAMHSAAKIFRPDQQLSTPRKSYGLLAEAHATTQVSRPRTRARARQERIRRNQGLRPRSHTMALRSSADDVFFEIASSGGARRQQSRSDRKNGWL